MKGQLPKAYLRIDPNIDQTHPEPLAMLRLLCAANRQPRRGEFKTRSLLDQLLGRSQVNRLIERGDLVQIGLGRWYVDHWSEWQEGDHTVGERMARLRALRDRNGAVTSPSPDRSTPSEASRRQGVKASDGSPSGEPIAREEAEAWRGDEDEALTWLARHGCAVRVGDGWHRQLVTAVATHGINAVVGMMDRLAEAGVKHGDTKGYLFGAIDALNARGRPKLADLEREERTDGQDRAHQNRLDATRRHIEELQGTP